MSTGNNPWQLDEETRKALASEWVGIRDRRPGSRIAAMKALTFVPPGPEKPPVPFGLALSGGGIRSATFNLGILQALAEKRLLRRIDFLSTVSGGGYIGGWLSALIHHQGGGEVEALEQPGPEGIAPPVDGKEAGEHPAILHLRRYSNYLTPRYGVFSVDTLAAVANLLRNLMLNMPILIGLLAALLLLPRVLVQAGERIAYCCDDSLWLLAVAALLLLWSAVGASLGLQSLAQIGAAAGGKGEAASSIGGGPAVGEAPPPSIPEGEASALQRPGWSQGKVFRHAVLPSFLGVMVFVWWLLVGEFTGSGPWEGELLIWVVVGSLAYAAIWGSGWWLARLLAGGERQSRGFWVALAAVVSPFVGGAVTGALFYACARGLASLPAGHGSWLAIGLGVAVVWEALCVGIVAHVGMGKRLFTEAMREWLGRAGGQSFALGLPWMGLSLLALYGPPLVAWLNDWLLFGGGLAWLATTVGGVVLARGDKTSGTEARPWADRLSAWAPYVFVVGLALLLAVAAERSLMAYADIELPEQAAATAGTEIKGRIWQGGFELALDDQCRGDADCSLTARIEAKRKSLLEFANEHRQWDRELAARMPWAAPAALVLMVALMLLLAWRVDVNLFSMHQFYRNRLTRCYLGASRPERRGDAFTDFDFDDDLALAALRHQRPFHLVCATLNISRSDHLEWQQRQAAPFVFTPSQCGFRLPDGKDRGAFRPTADYMSREGGGKGNGGARLGMAVAVSGAAASPAMGYHTAPATAFLMTFFNVRLGRWCGNPRHETDWRLSSPRFGLRYLIDELMAATDETSAFVNLSDGGHFENLGLYELVRRRCRLIVVCDSGCDPRFEFEDLGNAIRKCRVDLGAEISIDVSPLVAGDPARRARSVIGRIDYADREEPGVLVYVKPLLRGDEVIDVRHYAATHKDFPHQSTGDQWFDEAQFESYRQLGLASGREVFGRHAWEVAGPDGEDNDDWVRIVASRLAKSLPTRLGGLGSTGGGGRT